MVINFPTSKKIIGCNIAAKQSYGVGMAYVDAWWTLFQSWDWTGWIKPQIDYAVGNGIGCNCIRLIGSLEGVFASKFSQNTYNTNWQQLVDYCASLGVYVYFTGGNCPQVSAASATYNVGAGASMTNQQIADGINNTLSALSGRGNIIAVDVMQENNAWGPVCGEANPATRTIDIYNKVKAGGTALPLSFSTSDNWTGGGGSAAASWLASISSAMDHLDFHFYTVIGPNYNATNPIALSDFAYWRATYPTLDIVSGEFGQQETQTYDQQASFYQSILNGFTQGDVKVRGAMAWAGSDGNNVTSDEWGLYDVTFATPRIGKTRLLRQYAGGSVARRN